MAQLRLSELSGRAKELYGELQYPIASIALDMAAATEADSIARKIFTRQKSTHRVESYGAMTAVDSFKPVGENGAYPTGGFESGYFKFLENIVWKGSFAVSREMRDDVQAIDLKSVPSALFSDYQRKFENFFAGLLANAAKGSTSYTMEGFAFDLKSADGVAQFSKSHPMKIKGGTQSNLYAGAFSADTLGGVATKMQNVQDDNGNVMSLVPDTLIIPNFAALKKAVFGVIGANKVPGSANNDYNYLFENWSVYVWPYLNNFFTEGTDAPFFVMDSNYNVKARTAIFQDRVELEISDEVGSNDEYLWKGYSRFTGGFNDFRGIFVGGVTGGTAL